MIWYGNGVQYVMIRFTTSKQLLNMLQSLDILLYVFNIFLAYLSTSV